MTCACSLSRFRWLRRLCPLVCALVGCCSLPSAEAQNLGKPLQSIDEEITAFAYAPDGRIVYFRWSTNGHFILAQLLTTTVLDDTGKTEDSIQTLLLDDSGREIRINKGDSVIPDAANATWLPDNATIAFLSEAMKPHMLFSLKFTRPATGALLSFYEGRTFRDVAWLPGVNSAIAVEQDHNLTGPSRLQRLDLLSDDAKELATLEGYEGGVSVSPSGKKVAYFIDKEILEIRDLTSLNRVARLRVGLGVFRWSSDESRILLKRSLEKKSGDLVWIDLPPLTASSGHDVPVSQPQPISILHGLSFRDFAISPDGRFLAVVITGKRNLLVFPLPSR